jgi:hypothetical protein
MGQILNSKYCADIAAVLLTESKPGLATFRITVLEARAAVLQWSKPAYIILTVLTMMYNTQNYWLYRLYPSPGILND